MITKSLKTWSERMQPEIMRNLELASESKLGLWSNFLNDYRAFQSNPIINIDPLGLEATTQPAEPPIFKGFEKDRYQQHDALIARLVDDFNKNKQKYCGCTDKQADKVSNLDPALIKSWLIQETGGNDERSRAAWEKDPAQVNVPGQDWDKWKEDIGLKKPTRRNEGDLETNLRAALMWLCRKGFGGSGQPARRRQNGFFDGWREALIRYNGRGDKTENGKPYRDNYADRIIGRAFDPTNYYPIELPRVQ